MNKRKKNIINFPFWWFFRQKTRTLNAEIGSHVLCLLKMRLLLWFYFYKIIIHFFREKCKSDLILHKLLLLDYTPYQNRVSVHAWEKKNQTNSKKIIFLLFLKTPITPTPVLLRLQQTLEQILFEIFGLIFGFILIFLETPQRLWSTKEMLMLQQFYYLILIKFEQPQEKPRKMTKHKLNLNLKRLLLIVLTLKLYFSLFSSYFSLLCLRLWMNGCLHQKILKY